MRLAEALQLRSDLQKRIYQLQERLNQNATVQEGEKPAEDPVSLLHELDGCIAQLEELMERTILAMRSCEAKVAAELDALLN